jgi:hypothetical protein
MKLNESDLHVLLSVLNKEQDTLMDANDDERADILDELIEKLSDEWEKKYPKSEPKPFYE